MELTEHSAHITQRNAENDRTRFSLDNLQWKVKRRIIVQIEDPCQLAKCSRAWNNQVNLPSTKAEWLIHQNGTHALFHAVKRGENIKVIMSLFEQGVHLSRYFSQKLKNSYGKEDPKLIALRREYDADRGTDNNGISWASNTGLDVFFYIIQKTNEKFGEDQTFLGENDM
ncbi:6481_t:CDS:1, partial [Paraglomus occultum]